MRKKLYMPNMKTEQGMLTSKANISPNNPIKDGTAVQLSHINSYAQNVTWIYKYLVNYNDFFGFGCHSFLISVSDLIQASGMDSL